MRGVIQITKNLRVKYVQVEFYKEPNRTEVAKAIVEGLKKEFGPSIATSSLPSVSIIVDVDGFEYMLDVDCNDLHEAIEDAIHMIYLIENYNGYNLLAKLDIMYEDDLVYETASDLEQVLNGIEILGHPTDIDEVILDFICGSSEHDADRFSTAVLKSMTTGQKFRLAKELYEVEYNKENELLYVINWEDLK